MKTYIRVTLSLDQRTLDILKAIKGKTNSDKVKAALEQLYVRQEGKRYEQGL